MAQLCNYLSFKEFVEKYGLKDEATSNVKIKEILKLMNTSCGIYMRDDKFTTSSGITYTPQLEHTGLCIQTKTILIHMAVHHQ